MWWVISLVKIIIIYWIELKLLSFQFLFTSFSAEIITSHLYYIIHKCQCHNFSSCFILFSLSHSLSSCCCTFFFLLPSPLALSPSPFPSLPSHFSLSLTQKSSQSLRSPSFPASTCWQEEREEDAALYPRCVLATPPASAHCF